MDQGLSLGRISGYDKIMKMLTSPLQVLINNPIAAGAALAAFSAVALAMAFMAEHFYGLEPCILCLYQRLPFVLAVFLGLVSVWATCMTPKSAPYTLGLLGVTFAANVLIAAYHTGVERHWWKSFLEGCAVPAMEGNITDVLAKIEATTNVVRCDEIPWVDPVLGLSMANYNVVFCAVLAFIAFSAARSAKRP